MRKGRTVQSSGSNLESGQRVAGRPQRRHMAFHVATSLGIESAPEQESERRHRWAVIGNHKYERSKARGRRMSI